MKTPRSTRSLTRITAALAASALFFAACGDDDEVDTTAVDEPFDEAVEEDLGDGLAEEIIDEDVVEEDMADEDMAEGAMVLETPLDSLNDSGVTGTAMVEVNDDGTITVTLETEGFVGGNPHAQHLHIGGNNECPDMSAAGDDGILTSAEGVPAYGEVQVSLTTEGDVGADSALAVERFPVADENGMVTYERTFELPPAMLDSVGLNMSTDDLADAVVVQHGFASMGGDEAVYDGDMQSSLDPSLPLEATIPVACGALSMQ